MFTFTKFHSFYILILLKGVAIFMNMRFIKHYFTYFVAVCILILSVLPLPIYASEVNPLPTINSQAAILIDAKTGKILYEKDAYSTYFPASITKLMTALLAIENLKPTDTITFSQEAIRSMPPGSSSIGIFPGEQLTVDQALHGLLLMSSNEIANGLAEAVSGSIDQFASLMTKKAKELGCLNTNFVNPHGFHDINHYTTAYDMALIMRELYNNDYFLEIMSHPVYQIPPTNKSSEPRPLSQQHGLMNRIKNSALYRDDVIGGKTGFHDQAGNTLVTAARRGDIDLIVVTLKGQGVNMYKDTSNLLDYGFNAYHTLELHKTSSVLKTLPVYAVKSGELIEAAQCDVTVGSNESLLISRDIKLRDISTKLNIPEYLQLGIKEKAKVGTIDYIYANQIIASTDLVASKIHFVSSPFNVTSPQPSNLVFPLEWLIGIIVVILILILTFAYFRRQSKNHYAKNKRLKFSKTIK